MRELYQELILGHNKNPRNRREILDATHMHEGFNPLCGDRVTIFLKIHDGIVEDAAFQGVGCAISTASTSMMTEAIQGKTEADVEAIADAFSNLVLRIGPPDQERLGKLAVFAGVGEFPARVKCATLSWHTLRAALEGKPEAVTTE